VVPPKVTIATDYYATAPTSVSSPDKLKQVLLNLMKNAFEAMPDGGILNLSTSRWSDGGAGNHVEIVIEDTGPGLPEAILRNIYQPVSSTKGGQHFGIGLSIAGQLVREMHGLINYRSSRHGCRFRIILPVVTS
jgi:signal transduction histidine kinase